MITYPSSIKNLIESFKKLPGIGEKTAERLALSILSMEQARVELFAESLVNVKNLVKRCSICNHLTENEICDICDSSDRNPKVICVVEEPKNVILFEKVGSYNGKYHVLDGLISPLDGINPEDINIKTLISRVKDDNIEEVIIAVKPSIEGETTALYISKLFEGMDVIISKIAHGVPLGTDMEYIDSLTLEMALEDRKKISNSNEV